MNRSWGKGNLKRSIYEYVDSEHKNRIGSCEWLPSDGDLCVCISPAGDYFDDYIVIREQEGGKYGEAGRFGAYSFGEPMGKLSERNFHLLQAGEAINL